MPGEKYLPGAKAYPGGGVDIEVVRSFGFCKYDG
jgi:hypothetical protein